MELTLIRVTHGLRALEGITGLTQHTSVNRGHLSVLLIIRGTGYISRLLSVELIGRILSVRQSPPGPPGNVRISASVKRHSPILYGETAPITFTHDDMTRRRAGTAELSTDNTFFEAGTI